MAIIGGKPVLEHQVELAKNHGFEEILLLTGYAACKIENHFQDGRRWGVRIRYQVENQPLGTAGAVMSVLESLPEVFLVLYGDTMPHVALNRIWKFHEQRDADITLLVHPNDHPHDSDLIELDEAGMVKSFHPYPHDPASYHNNLVNAGLYVVNKRALPPWTGRPVKMDFATELFPALLRQGKRLLGYSSREYIKDIGTPARLAQVEADWQRGKIHSLSLDRLCPAIFLDRDGTLNIERNRITRVEQLQLIPGAGEAVRRINQAGVLAVVATNQPVVARGEVSEAQLRLIHNKLENLLGDCGAFLNGIYWCPHHPDRGFPGERPELKQDCACRKPAPGLIHRAAAELGIDLARSWLIGDSTTDIRTARNAGLQAALVRTGLAGRDGRYPDVPDGEFSDLPEAVDFVLNQMAIV